MAINVRKKVLLRQQLLFGVSGLAIGFAATINSPAFAQEDTFDKIVVTSQKREQSIEDVPVSVAVLDKEFIDQSDIRNLTDYLELVPGLTAETGGNSGAAINVRVRGIGALGGNTNTFGLYVDEFDVTGASTSLAGTRLVDAERLEVLRGPQGTTFGRNVVAGAISITSQTPSTEGVSGRAALDFGSDGIFGVQGRLNLPIADSTAVLLSGFYEETDGYINNVTPTGTPEDSREDFGFRASLQSDPTDRLSIKASASFERLTQDLRRQVTDGSSNPQVQNFISIIGLGLNPFIPASAATPPLDEFFPDQASLHEPNSRENSQFESVIGTLRVSYDFGPGSLIWVSGIASSERESVFDNDASALDNLATQADLDTQFASTELRYQSNGDERLDYVVGVFASQGEEDSYGLTLAGETLRTSSFIPAMFLGPLMSTFPDGLFAVDVPPGETVLEARSHSETAGYAIFADIDFEVTDRWNVLVGGRYNYDEESQEVSDVVELSPDPTFPVPNFLFQPVEFSDASGEVDFDQVTWRISTVYDLTNAINVYGTISTGYRPGGLQLSNVTVSSNEQLEFFPEEIINYEAGFKSSFFDRRLLLNGSVFFSEWTDIQLAFTDPINGIPFAGNGEAEAFGFEVDALANLFEGLTLQGGIAYLDSEVTSLAGGIAQQAVVGAPLPYAPEWSGTLTATYDRLILD